MHYLQIIMMQSEKNLYIRYYEQQGSRAAVVQGGS
jgi:hypothetical protein